MAGPGKSESGKSGLVEAQKATRKAAKPTVAQLKWLAKGASQPGGKLPLFDDSGREIPARTIRACVDAGWAEPWFSNPIKPDWMVCKLTDDGAALVKTKASARKS